MKLKYEKPSIDIEAFSLDANIAGNCGLIVTTGPAMDGHSPCEDYIEKYEPESRPGNQMMDATYNLDFWESCDCYYTAAGVFMAS